MDNRDRRNTTILYISVGLCLFLYLSTYLLNSSKDEESTDENNATEEIINETNLIPEKPKKIKMIIIRQPTTHISFMHTNLLPVITYDLYMKHEMCTPEDIHNEEKHKIPPKAASKTIKMSEPRAMMVIYVAFGLLLLSFGAALLDLFKAKTEMSRATELGKKKPSLTRKCSLADLTVLRHARKESMRKEFYDTNTSPHATGRKVSRPPLRLD